MKRSCVIVGAGHRAMTYASYVHEHPDRMEVIGVADPIERRRQQAADTFGLDPTNIFSSAE